jgi:hypothetical protein
MFIYAMKINLNIYPKKLKIEKRCNVVKKIQNANMENEMQCVKIKCNM